MKATCIFTVLFFITFLKGYSQHHGDTTFLDKKFKVCAKDTATYYRLYERSNDLYLVKDYFMSGVLEMTGQSLDNSDTLNRTGEFLLYTESGALHSRIFFLNNKTEGLATHYYINNGSVFFTKTYTKGLANGPAKYYFPDSSLRREENYKMGKLKKGKCYTESGKDTTYYPATAFPEFKGGKKKMIKYLAENTHYPSEEMKNNVTGRVLVFFTVNKQGDIQDVHIKTPSNENLDKEAIRVVKSMPRWYPGRNYDVNVNVKFNVGITFKLP